MIYLKKKKNINYFIKDFSKNLKLGVYEDSKKRKN